MKTSCLEYTSQTKERKVNVYFLDKADSYLYFIQDLMQYYEQSSDNSFILCKWNTRITNAYKS